MYFITGWEGSGEKHTFVYLKFDVFGEPLRVITLISYKPLTEQRRDFRMSYAYIAVDTCQIFKNSNHLSGFLLSLNPLARIFVVSLRYGTVYMP